MTATACVKLAFLWAVLCMQVWAQSRHNQYASILQDSRNEPTPDGHFGYLYKTEDGIVSSARGDPSGVIHGTFSYTDPTGLKVNYNYNAGSRFTPGLNYNKGHASAAAPGRGGGAASKPRYEEDYDDGQYREQPEEQYVEPAPQYRPRGRVSYRDPADYQERRNRPLTRGNDLYDDYRA